VTPFRASPGFTDTWQHFDLTIEDYVATITFTRPERLNALTFDVYADLRDVFLELPQRGDVRVIVIRGTGRGFCSGGDVDDIIGELQSMEAHELLDFTRMTGQVIKNMREIPLPIIAQVNGIAAGAGSVIAIASDIRVMAEEAKLAFLFTKVGLAGADMGAAYLLPRMIGLSKASELLLLGESIDAATAERLGLAREVVPADQLDDTVKALARRLADGPALGYASTKSLLTRELDMDLSSSVELEAWTQALLMKSHDHGEFYRSFKAKREPNWQGR